MLDVQQDGGSPRRSPNGLLALLGCLVCLALVGCGRGSPPLSTEPDPSTDVSQLMKLLKDKEPGMRNLAARRLGRLGVTAEAALPELRKAAQHDKNEAVRKSAAEAVERISEGSAP